VGGSTRLVDEHIALLAAAITLATASRYASKCYVGWAVSIRQWQRGEDRMNAKIERVYIGCTFKWYSIGMWQGGNWIILDTDKSRKRLQTKWEGKGYTVELDLR
jgi:hypothetical protein